MKNQIKTHTLRLALRLESFKDAARIREAAKGIQQTIDNEIEIVLNRNNKENLNMNEGVIEFLTAGKVPATRAKQQAWLEQVIKSLKEASLPDEAAPVKAINSKYKLTVEKFIKWDDKYNKLVDLDRGIDSVKQREAFNKANYFFSGLPKTEQRNLIKNVCGAEYYK